MQCVGEAGGYTRITPSDWMATPERADRKANPYQQTDRSRFGFLKIDRFDPLLGGSFREEIFAS